MAVKRLCGHDGQIKKCLARRCRLFINILCVFCGRWLPEPEFMTSSTSWASPSLRTRGTRRWPGCAAAGNGKTFCHFLSEGSSSERGSLWNAPRQYCAFQNKRHLTITLLRLLYLVLYYASLHLFVCVTASSSFFYSLPVLAFCHVSMLSLSRMLLLY